MKVLAGDDGPHLAPSEQATRAVLALPDTPDLQEELDAMISDIKEANLDLPDEVIRMCTSYMARCTELHVRLTRVEGSNRHFRGFRNLELVKVMELIEFTYRSASRLIEMRRQDVELSR